MRMRSIEAELLCLFVCTCIACHPAAGKSVKANKLSDWCEATVCSTLRLKLVCELFYESDFPFTF